MLFPEKSGAYIIEYAILPRGSSFIAVLNMRDMKGGAEMAVARGKNIWIDFFALLI